MSQNYHSVTFGPCTLIYADSEELLRSGTLPKADALISDPYYGVGSINGGGGRNPMSRNNPGNFAGNDQPFDARPWIEHFSKRPIALMGADHYSATLPNGGRFFCWDKSCGMGTTANIIDAEFGWVNRRNPRNVFRQFWMGATRSGEGASGKKKRLHISQKPVELMCWIIELARVGVGKTVLDPYMGSASTGIACLRTGRKFIGIEIEKRMFDIECERVSSEVDRCGA